VEEGMDDIRGLGKVPESVDAQFRDCGGVSVG
jgi:hypothetical protein